MPLIAKETGGARIDPVPEGVHIAVCYGVIDLGTHFNDAFQKSSHKVLIQWELPECRGQFERDGVLMDLPRAISNRYTLSLHENSQLRSNLESWLGRKLTADELEGFDLQQLIGKGCQLQVLHGTKGDKVYSNITALMALPKAIAAPKLENPPAYFAFGDQDSVGIETLPQWVREIIMASDEWKALTPAKADPSPSAKPKPWEAPAKPSTVRVTMPPKPVLPWREHIIHFGKNTGIKLKDLRLASLQWYYHDWKPQPDEEGWISESDAALKQALDQAAKEFKWGQYREPEPEVPPVDPDDDVPF